MEQSIKLLIKRNKQNENENEDFKKILVNLFSSFIFS
jgi:hypothetical protein